MFSFKTITRAIPIECDSLEYSNKYGDEYDSDYNGAIDSSVYLFYSGGYLVRVELDKGDNGTIDSVWYHTNDGNALRHMDDDRDEEGNANKEQRAYKSSKLGTVLSTLRVIESAIWSNHLGCRRLPLLLCFTIFAVLKAMQTVTKFL